MFTSMAVAAYSHMVYAEQVREAFEASIKDLPNELKATMRSERKKELKLQADEMTAERRHREMVQAVNSSGNGIPMAFLGGVILGSIL